MCILYLGWKSIWHAYLVKEYVQLRLVQHLNDDMISTCEFIMYRIVLECDSVILLRLDEHMGVMDCMHGDWVLWNLSKVPKISCSEATSVVPGSIR